MAKAVAITKKEKFRTQIQTGNHHFIVDEPIDAGGKDLGPKPTELLSAALASCSTITMKLYADRKGWDLQESKVEVEFQRELKDKTTVFHKKITLIGNLDEEQRTRIFEIASRCPVHRILENEVKIESKLEN